VAQPTERTTAYVKLLDEGIDVWRPVPADALGRGHYRLFPTDGYDSSRETWEFTPGTGAICEVRQLEDGLQLVAIRVA
jgi:hypothetical protein